MKFALFTLLVVTLIPNVTHAQESVGCVTDPAKYWVCSGDVSWGTGYILEPDKLTVEQVQIWREQAELLPAAEGERDTFQGQRDAALLDANLWREDYKALHLQYQNLTEDYNNAQDEIGDRFETYEVVAWTIGGTGIGVFAGMLIGALAL